MYTVPRVWLFVLTFHVTSSGSCRQRIISAILFSGARIRDGRRVRSARCPFRVPASRSSSSGSNPPSAETAIEPRPRGQSARIIKLQSVASSAQNNARHSAAGSHRWLRRGTIHNRNATRCDVSALTPPSSRNRKGKPWSFLGDPDSKFCVSLRSQLCARLAGLVCRLLTRPIERRAGRKQLERLVEPHARLDFLALA